MGAKIVEFPVGSRETAAERILHPRVERRLDLSCGVCARVQDGIARGNADHLLTPHDAVHHAAATVMSL